MRAPLLLALAIAAALAGPALAQQDTAEERMREMLRRTVAELRQAQDAQTTLQASLDQAKAENAALRKQVADLTAQAAEAAKHAISDADLAKLHADLATAQADATATHTALQQWQDAYQQAASLARAKDAESKTAAANLAETARELGVCTAANGKLESLGDDILHLYQTQSFRRLLLESYEPLLGLKRVELENTIQDYQDKLLDQKFHSPTAESKSAPTR